MGGHCIITRVINVVSYLYLYAKTPHDADQIYGRWQCIGTFLCYVVGRYVNQYDSVSQQVHCTGRS